MKSNKKTSLNFTAPFLPLDAIQDEMKDYIVPSLMIQMSEMEYLVLEFREEDEKHLLLKPLISHRQLEEV